MYNPFENTTCTIFKKEYVEVSRIASAVNSEAKFRKKYLNSTDGDFRYWNERENWFLIKFKQEKIKHVVQAGSIVWNNADEYDFIETLDAGPSLFDWLRVQPKMRDGTITPHPLSDPRAFLQMFEAVVKALTEIHKCGVIHGDIREPNICIPFTCRSSDGLLIAPEWSQLKLIDFAFSICRNHQLKYPIPIEPIRSHYSPAYCAALNLDFQLGFPRHVERLDWRVDFYSLGQLCSRLIERAKVSWPSGKVGADVRKKVLKIVNELVQCDTNSNSPDANFHLNLQSTIAEIISELGPSTNAVFSINKLHQTPLTVAPFEATDEVRHTHLHSPDFNDATQTSVPAPTPMRQPISIVKPGNTASRSRSPTVPRLSRIIIPTLKVKSWVDQFWGRVSDSVEVERFRSGAQRGDPESCYRMGMIYIRGNAVSQDFSAAFSWFLMAANASHTEAEANVAWMTEMGMGVARDEQIAFEWYQRSAQKGNPMAQHNLAITYVEGRGVKKDDLQAIHYLRLSAEAGFPSAFFSLGKMILAGRGVAKNFDDAIDCFRRGAELKHGESALELGRLIEKGGPGHLPDRVNALAWYRLAEKLGCSLASVDVSRLAAA